jgi:hypothetical protein
MERGENKITPNLKKNFRQKFSHPTQQNIKKEQNG